MYRLVASCHLGKTFKSTVIQKVKLPNGALGGSGRTLHAGSKIDYRKTKKQTSEKLNFSHTLVKLNFRNFESISLLKMPKDILFLKTCKSHTFKSHTSES